MKKIKDIQQIKEQIAKDDLKLIYISSLHCSVCHADQPKVEKIVEEYKIPAFHIDIMEVPEASGLFTAFTAPVVLLYFKGKEIHRQARIINFQELIYRIEQVQNFSE